MSRDALNSLLSAYLANGGKITVLPAGKRSRKRIRCKD